jgi:AraC-like DNA-binding protein
MQHAVVLLSTGASVTETALDSGYRSASAFVAAFKKSVGTTPARHRAASCRS